MKINGIQIGSNQSITSVGKVGECPQTSFTFTASFPNGLPGYVYGGKNTITTSTISGTTVMGPVTVTFNGSPESSMGGKVYVDIDNYDPNVDDLPKFTPGADINGKDVLLLPTASSQEVKLHIQPGTTKGRVSVYLTDVSRFYGTAINYPSFASADSSYDMDFGSGILTKENLMIPKSGDLVLSLFVKDYAAHATLKIVLPAKDGSTYSITKKLPIDADDNLISDAGWMVGNVRISATGKQALSDEDAAVGQTAGDSLTTFEEYRGAFLNGRFTRFDPQKMDLFVVLQSEQFDDVLEWKSDLVALPVLVHEVGLSDVYEELNPTLNFNCGLYRDAPSDPCLPQAALRVRSRTPSPPYLLADGTYAPSRSYGHTFVLDESVEFIGTDCLEAQPQSVLGTEVAEIYPDNLKNQAIAFEGSTPDSSPVLCSEARPTDCDEIDWLRKVILPGLDGTLQTVRAGTDFFTLQILDSDCVTGTDYGNFLNRQQMTEFLTMLVAHEGGHGLSMRHTRETDPARTCAHSVMRWNGTVATPVEHQYDAVDQTQIRIK
jgi:hypothetical protein